MKNVKSKILAPLFALAVILAGSIGAYAATVVSEPTDEANAVGSIVHRGGVIRLGTNLYVHQNSVHTAVGITGLHVINGCTLTLDLETQPGERVMAAIVDEDETVSKLGIMAGLSGGTGTATIYLYNRSGVQVCANSSIFGTNANLWVELTYTRTATP
jgi:hypothetical protein